MEQKSPKESTEKSSIFCSLARGIVIEKSSKSFELSSLLNGSTDNNQKDETECTDTRDKVRLPPFSFSCETGVVSELTQDHEKEPLNKGSDSMHPKETTSTLAGRKRPHPYAHEKTGKQTASISNPHENPFKKKCTAPPKGEAKQKTNKQNTECIANPSKNPFKKKCSTPPKGEAKQKTNPSENPFKKKCLTPSLSPKGEARQRPPPKASRNCDNPSLQRLKTRSLPLEENLVSHSLVNIKDCRDKLTEICRQYSVTQEIAHKKDDDLGCVTQEIAGHVQISFKGDDLGCVTDAMKETEKLLQLIEGNLEYREERLPCYYVPVLILELQSIDNLQRKHSVEIFMLDHNKNRSSLRDFSQLVTDNRLFKTKDLKQFISPNATSTFIWYSENDTKELCRVCDELSSKLNESYHKSVFEFKFSGKDYKINFSSDTILEMTQDKSIERKLKRTPGEWSYSDRPRSEGDSYEIQESPALEEMFQFGGETIQIGCNRCAVNFCDMTLTNMASGEKFILQRYPPVLCGTTDRLPDLEVSVLLHGLPQCTDAFLHDMLAEFETSMQVFDYKLLDSADETRVKDVSSLFSNIVRQYFVKASINSANLNGDLWLRISGVRSYVEVIPEKEIKSVVSDIEKLVLTKKLANMEQQLSEFEEKKMKQTRNHHLEDFSFPYYWVRPEEQIEDCEVMLIREQDPYGKKELDYVLQKMRETMPDVKLKRLERVQHKSLYKKYFLEKCLMGQGAVEMDLFHGTRSTDPNSVVRSEDGIDFRFGRSDSLLWGKGSYFAVKASYSDSYAHNLWDGSKQMLFVSVLVGNSKPYGSRKDKSLTLPPLLEGSTDKRYDSVNGISADSLIYIVYKHAKAYPLYIVTYTN